HRLDGEVVLLADFGLGHGHLHGQSGHTVRRCTYEPNVATLPAPNPERGADGPAAPPPLPVALRCPAGVSIGGPAAGGDPRRLRRRRDPAQRCAATRRLGP